MTPWSFDESGISRHRVGERERVREDTLKTTVKVHVSFLLIDEVDRRLRPLAELEGMSFLNLLKNGKKTLPPFFHTPSDAM